MHAFIYHLSGFSTFWGSSGTAILTVLCAVEGVERGAGLVGVGHQGGVASVPGHRTVLEGEVAGPLHPPVNHF